MKVRTLILGCALSVAMGATAAVSSTSVLAGPPKANSTAAPAVDAPELPTTYRTVAGHWVSEACQPSGTGASRASLLLDRNLFTLALPVYADPECKAKLFTLTVGGTYQLRGRSPDVQGARIARFTFGFRQITPHAQPIADAMTAANCGRAVSRVGFATDIFATGCAPLGQQSRQACPVEYELLKRTGNRIFLGARPADGGGLCSPQRQATTLGAGLIQG